MGTGFRLRDQLRSKAAEAMTAREMPAAANAVAQLSAELTTALPRGDGARKSSGSGKLLSGTAKGYMPAADLLESVPDAALSPTLRRVRA